MIRTHALAASGGKTWPEIPSQIPDPANPGETIANPVRATYIQGLTLQNALHQAHVAFELSALVTGLGAVFTALGAAIALLGIPAGFMLTKPKA